MTQFVNKIEQKFIRKVGDEYCVFSHESGKNFGCYKTKPEAEARLAQIHKFHGKENGMDKYVREVKKDDERPPKEWFDRCTEAVADIADDPGALCGWIFYHHKKDGLKLKMEKKQI